MKRTSLVLSLSAIFLSGIFLSSCSSERGFVVEKRHYGKGYYVHTNGNRSEEKTTEVASARVVNNNAAVVASDKVVSTNSIIENTGTTNKLVTNQNPQNAKHSAIQKPTVVAPEKIAEEKTSSAPHETIRPVMKSTQKNAPRDGDVNTALLVVLCIFIPFLAVYLKDGIGTPFWIDLILTLLFWLPGMIYAFIVCFA